MKKKLIIGTLLAIAVGMPLLAVYVSGLAALIAAGVLLLGMLVIRLAFGGPAKKDNDADYLFFFGE